MKSELDAVVVGAGPNGLAAGVVLAEAGLSVRVYEGAASAGGGCRTEELTLEGFRHDACSAVHPLAAASGFFRRFGLESRGVRLLQPEVALAHPLDGGRAGAVLRSVDETASRLGADRSRYVELFDPLVSNAEEIVSAVLSSLRSPLHRPMAVLGFGRLGLRSAAGLGAEFEGAEARALLGGLAAHSMRRLEALGTAGVGLLLGLLAHAVGWPVVEGGSKGITDALASAITARGGEIATGSPVRRLSELQPARIVMLDVSPKAVLEICSGLLPPRYRRQLEHFRYGPGVCKVDWALAEPVPWSSETCRLAGTVHVGGSLAEIARSELAVGAGRHPERPFVLCAQPGVVDPTRAPSGRHTLWSYCHVPAGSDRDMSGEIAAQIERFAPGFKDVVLAKAVRTASEAESSNPNYVGGDIACGVQDLRQTFARPALRWDPYRTPLPGVYLCSSATPPGAGVHGRCGELAARSALRRELGMRSRTDVSSKRHPTESPPDEPGPHPGASPRPLGEGGIECV